VREVGAELSQHQGNTRCNISASAHFDLHLGLHQVHDGSLWQAAVCVGEKAKDQWHAGGR
jgi:hypothetical protein